MLIKKRNSFLALLLFMSVMLFAQKKPAIYKIDDLLKRIHNNSDTIYVVNFWATWCKPCVSELPDFEKFYRQNKPAIVKIILVTMDFREDLDSKVMPFLKKNNYSPEIVLLDEVNGNDFINKVHTKWGGAKGFFGSGSLLLLRISGQGQVLMAAYGAIEVRDHESDGAVGILGKCDPVAADDLASRYRRAGLECRPIAVGD